MYLGPGGKFTRKVAALPVHDAIDKYGDMFADMALIIQHVVPQPWRGGERCLQYMLQATGNHVLRRAGDVPLQCWRELDVNHARNLPRGRPRKCGCAANYRTHYAQRFALTYTTFTGELIMSDLVADYQSLRPALALNRRGFVHGTLGIGFAAAVMPVASQTMIKTDTAGLEAGEVMIPVGVDLLPAYVAKPVGKSNLPTVLVVQEIFGVHEHIADVCRRFAKQGYLAIAPELYFRQGDPRGYTDIPKLMSDIVSKVPDAQVMSDLDAVANWALARDGSNRLFITGFCWGGRITWLYSAHNAAVKAGVAWYGRLVGQASPNTPKHPIDVVNDLKAPVLGLYGEADTGIHIDTVWKMQDAMKNSASKAAKDSTFKVYDQAPHAFHADYRPSYRKEAAEDGWKRCLKWFADAA
jgi:carboxymethylenebutenolidase